MSGCVVFSFGEGFGRPGAVAAASAAAHVPAGVEVVVATTGLTDATAELVAAGVREQGVAVRFVDSSPWVAELPVVSRYVADTWTRVFTAEWLPGEFERVVYLDADTVTVGPLEELFSVSLRSDLLALPDPVFPDFAARGPEFLEASGGEPASPYFNTGALVMDRSRWDGVASRALDVIDGGRLPFDFVDQDVLNVVMRGRWQELDPRWHRLVGPSDPIPEGAVLHFTGPVKPWAADAEAGPALDRYREAASTVGWTW